ncbi:thioester reductase domain-containing protein [Micromonospora pallida]|uniref:Thioester reductase domain-containing protein n=1 Tax=Micromonospora pallida TaxID=145854 RepID=A0A1C6S8L1_9ACTN|nr:type I polyketide synthase [Micromonospora pallida]SCL25723.1 thioester reductase domain-containing protein [Micromonospora pallida]
MSAHLDSTGAAPDAGPPDGVEPIAIIGMACRVPGADTVTGFWANMLDGVDSITRFTADELRAAGVDPHLLADPEYVPAGAVIDDADHFDAEFFGYNAAEAETMDPQQRIFCEVAWTALEDSGHTPDRTDGAVGVFAGTFMNKYLMANLATNPRFQRSAMAPLARIFNDKDFLATRVAYLLDLNGPACTVQTACSTSLVATHLACQSLLTYESDLALAGGVTINLPLKAGYSHAYSGVFSPDGRCRPFDADAAGTVPGNGAVVLVLRRLSDALADRDHIYAVIRASAVNNDGAVKAGFTAPSVDGQARVVTATHALAAISPGSIGYLETHGTATRVGDPIEVAALTQAFRVGTARRGFCALGSVKANIGHLDAAAGAAGLMRAALAVRHGRIPPMPGFRSPNPDLDLDTSPFYVPTRVTEWPADAGPRRAGVSAFGVGGTNAHVVLEQPPPIPEPAVPAPATGWHLVPLSARSRTAVDAATRRLADHLEEHPDLDLADVAFTLQDGRRDFPVRRFAACADLPDLVAVLRGEDPHRLVTRTAADTVHRAVFMFPGGGNQHREMGADLYRCHPVFRAEIDRCAALLRDRLDVDLTALLFPAGGGGPGRGRGLGRAEGPGVVTALFAVEYALAKLWMSWGVEPAAMLGHSLGEYVAACLSGVFTLGDALAVTYARGELFARMAPGRMLAVPLPEAQVAELLDERLSIAAVNAPELTVVAGPDGDIAALDRRLADRGVDCGRINVPAASHSWLVEPMLDEFTARVKECDLRPPHSPFVSGVTGDWIRAEDATDPHYWARHLRQPVRFADALRTVVTAPDRVLLEVGPGRALTALVPGQRLAPTPTAVASLGHPRDRLPDTAHLMAAVGRLWQAGVTVDWPALHSSRPARRVSLPGYPFQRRRYWVEPGTTAVVPGPADPAGAPSSDTAAVDVASNAADLADAPEDGYLAPRDERERQVARVWCDLLGVDRISVTDDLFDCGAHSLMITQAARELRRLGAPQLTAGDVLASPTVAGLAARIEAAVSGRPLIEVHGNGPDLAAEVLLDPAVAPDPGTPARTGPPKVVLLTGATGFVGAFLCAELVRQTSAEIVCLVRAASPEEGTERLQNALASYGLPSPPAHRLRVVPADLAKPRLGLTPAEFDALADEVDAIYHCGAWVNFVRPYRSLKATNVRGTEEVLRLSTRGRTTPVHYVSTLAVLAGAVAGGAGEVREDDPLPPPVGHDTAYSQSKWVAEGLIGIARERGVPVSVYRAGAVLGDSRTGATNREDYVTKVIQGCLDLGLAPTRRYAFAAASVDYVARTVVALSLRPETLGCTFHTVNPEPLDWNDIFGHLRASGYRVPSVDWPHWRHQLTEQIEADETANTLAPLMAMLGDTTDRDMPRMRCDNVWSALPADLARPPELDVALFARMLGFLARRGVLPAPPDADPRPAVPDTTRENLP